MSIELHQCDNCSGIFPEHKIVTEIPDYHQRVDPGGTVPSGECPKCGALVYPFEVDGANTNDDGVLVDADDEPIYCDSDTCQAEAMHRVLVSVNEPCDEMRHYCEGCYNVYMVGVQHGRNHEAARFNQRPARTSSQEYPVQEGVAS